MRNLSNATPVRERYLRRFVATGLCFIVFAAGCLGFALLVVPATRVAPAAARRERVRRMLGCAMRGFARFMRATGVLSYETHGVERLGRPGQLILANHPTLIDAVFLLGFASSSNCVVKDALARNALTRWTVAAAGYVSNSPTDRMIESAASALRDGQSVIMFPEGTRTVPGRPLQFHRGAAAIAIRAAAVVTPVHIECRPPTLAKSDPWYRIPERRAHLAFRTGADLDPEPFRRSAPAPIAARAFNEELLRIFTTECTLGRPIGRVC
ncbi:MAG TPA: lysophospholipid acyltransferase family protein [Steroidobacteraceae bacterium]|nr:lysophospholipid acyltransferase family protein [Steroidobacteraceae bacterium]